MEWLLNASWSAAPAILTVLSWKAGALVLLAGLLATALRRRSAALRHRVWTLAALGLLGLPALQWLMPPLAVPVPLALDRSSARPAMATSRAGDLPVALEAAARARRAPSASRRTTDRGDLPAARVPASTWLALAWAAGAAAVLGWFAAGKLALRRWIARSRPVADPAWQRVLDRLACELGVRRRVRLLASREGAPPVTAGFLRPLILLPESALGWPEAERRSFLAHELAHVARGDCAIQDLAHLACVLYWFHPGAWLAAHRLRIEREHACDDRVLGAGIAPAAYAQQLVDFARAARGARGPLRLAGAAMATTSRLESRVRSLLDGSRDRSPLGGAGAALAAIAALAFVLPLATIAPTNAAERTEARRLAAAGTLAARWNQALESRPSGRAFWIAYAIPFDGGRDGNEVLLSDSDGWDAGDLSGRGPSLAKRLGVDEGDAVLLFRVPARRPAGALRFDRVALRSAKLSPDLDGLPVESLGRASLDESVAWLAQQIDDGPDDRRVEALVTSLALHDTPRVPPLLIGWLDGKRGAAVRVHAAEGLARHPGERSLEALVEHTRRDRSQDVRREAAEAIGDLDDPAATPALIELSRTLDDPIVQVEAVESLGAREPERVVSVLESLAEDADDETVRREAVETLGDLPRNSGLETLRRLARHHDEAVRSEAIETLDEMGARAERAAKRR